MVRTQPRRVELLSLEVPPVGRTETYRHEGRVTTDRMPDGKTLLVDSMTREKRFLDGEWELVIGDDGRAAVAKVPVEGEADRFDLVE